MTHLQTSGITPDQHAEQCAWNRELNFYPLFVAHEVKDNRRRVIHLDVDWYFPCAKQAMLFKLRWC